MSRVRRAEPGTFYLGPYGYLHPTTGQYAPDYYLFECARQIQGGRLGVLPRRSTQGPTDPDADDTLSTVNFMDLTSGVGTRVIDPSTITKAVAWSTMDLRYTDGWTNAPRPHTAKPGTYSGNVTDFVRIGTSLYGLWGDHLHKYNPDDRTWGSGTDLTETPVGRAVVFNEVAYFPCGSAGYVTISESSPGTIGSPTVIAGAATPTSNSPKPTSNPRPLLFTIYAENLYCLTISSEGYALANSPTGATGTWTWPFRTNYQTFVKVNTSYTPHALVEFINRDGNPALWCIHSRGALRYDEQNFSWASTNLRNLPPHPDVGLDAMVYPPGGDLWIVGGGGDMIQYTTNNVAQPGAGPGGTGGGIPAVKRGSIVSLTSDLSNMYCLMRGDTALDSSPSMVEDAPADPLYVPDALAVTSLLAYNTKGWFPLFETTEPSGTPTVCVVADPLKTDGTCDYRIHWGIGEDAWSMPCRLTMYSAQQGREEGIDEFADVSYIEFGWYHAGSISRKKLFSHAAVILTHGDEETEFVEVEYQTDADPPTTWHSLGIAWNPDERTILPFGLSEDLRFSSGLSCNRIKLRLTSSGLGGATSTPVPFALSLAYLIVPIDAGNFILHVPLPVDTDEQSQKTRERISSMMYGFAESQEFLHMIFNEEHMRVYVAGISETKIAGRDAPGALKLNLVQVITGLESELSDAA